MTKLYFVTSIVSRQIAGYTGAMIYNHAIPGGRNERAGVANYHEILDQAVALQADLGLTQAELASRVDTTQSAISDMLSRRRNQPRVGTILGILQAMGHTLAVVPIHERSAPMGGATPAETALPGQSAIREYALGCLASQQQREPLWTQPTVYMGPMERIEL